jgi:hypothetical protein
MPLFLQKGIFGALARIARWRGYDPEFSKYTNPEGLTEGRTSPSGEAQHAQLDRGRRSTQLYGLASGRSLRILAALTAMLALFLLLLRRRIH